MRRRATAERADAEMVRLLSEASELSEESKTAGSVAEALCNGGKS